MVCQIFCLIRLMEVVRKLKKKRLDKPVLLLGRVCHSLCIFFGQKAVIWRQLLILIRFRDWGNDDYKAMYGRTSAPPPDIKDDLGFFFSLSFVKTRIFLLLPASTQPTTHS